MTSVMCITLVSCTASDPGQTDRFPENAGNDPIPASSPALQPDAAGASTSTTQTTAQPTETIDSTGTAIQETFSPPPALTETELSSDSSPQRVTITVYRIDSFCEDFIPEPIRVEPDRAIEQAIGKVLESEDNREFELAGYRVKVDAASGMATVDLRLSPNSPRKIVSLSSCEQLALFGSLRETLLGNPEWNIETVRFTERGQEIVL